LTLVQNNSSVMPNEAPPSWEDTQELSADSAPPSWEDTSVYVEPPAPLRPNRVRAGLNQTIQAVYRPLDILTNPASVAASEMGREVAQRRREAQMGVVAPGSFFPVPQPLAEPTPEDKAAGAQLVRSITGIPGQIISAGARTVRDVLSPSTYLPEELKTPPPFVISTRGEQPELRQMTRGEEALRDPLQAGRGLLPVRGTQLDPEGSQGAQLLSGLSSLDNIGIIAAGGASKVAGMALLFSMAPGIYEDVKKIASSDTPLEQKQQAINNLIVPLILGAKSGYERPALEKPQISGPPAMGSMLNIPEGARPPVARSAELVGPPVPARAKFLRPEVPGTPAEPRESQIATIRRLGARTRNEIKALFPKAELSNEEAAALRNEAWGKPQEPPAKAPKFEETTPIEQAPPAAPPPEQLTPEDRIERQTAKADHTDIEQANQMSGPDLIAALKGKGGITGGAYELGAKLTPETRAKARQYEQEANTAAMAALERSKAETDRAKGLSILQQESFPAQAKKQFFNEAGRFYDAVQDVKSGKDVAQAAIDFGVDEATLRRVAEAAPAEAAATLEPKPGMVRLYHGEGATEGAGAGGGWFTEKPDYAAQFGKVTFVDVPQAVADAARGAARATGTGGPHFILPDEYVKQAKPMATQPGPKVYDVTEEPAAPPAGRDWELFGENLRADLDSFSPARSTGRVSYELEDVADRFVEFAKGDKSGAPIEKLVSEFAKDDEASPSQIKKLRQAVKSVLASEAPPAAPETPPAAPAPAAPAAPAGPDPLDKVSIAGRPIKAWMAVTKTDQLPTGYEFTMMAKRLGVKRDRKTVLEALHNEKRLREIFKPFEQPAQPAPAAPAVSIPAPSTEAPKMDKPTKTLKGTYLRDFPEGTKIQRGNETLTIIKQKKNSTMVGTAGDPTGYEMSWSADVGNWGKIEQQAAPETSEVPADIKRRLPVGFDETTARMENGKVVVKQKPLYGGKWMIVDVKKATAEPYAPAAQAEPEKITAAAYQPQPGQTETGANHPEILGRLGVKGFESPESRNTPQFGFQTNKRPFITREQAGPVAEASGQNLKEFEPGEPVHSNEVASPTEPEKPLSETQPPEVFSVKQTDRGFEVWNNTKGRAEGHAPYKTKSAAQGLADKLNRSAPAKPDLAAATGEAPPPVPFEGPAVGSPEAQSVLERATAADTKVSDLYTKLSDAEAELDKTKYGTKKQEQLKRKVEKLRDQYGEASRETKLIRQGARLLRLRELAETGDPAQRWAASAEYARKIAEIADEELAKLRHTPGRGASNDTFFWQVADRARRFGAIAKEISDKGYPLFTEKVSKQLQELGATKEEADFEAGQIVNMQFSYPGMTSVKDAPLRMQSIGLQRLREDTTKKAEGLKQEYGVLHDTGLERRAREVMDEKAAGALLAEYRQEYQRRKSEVERQEKAKETAKQEGQANEITKAKSIDPEKLRWYYDDGIWRAVEGKTVKVPIAPEYEFFVHKAPRGGGYSVTEASTGLRVGTGGSHKAAIANANERLTGLDPGDVTRKKKLAELIQKQIPAEPRPLGPEAIGPGSAARLEFEGPEFESPDPQALGLSAGSPFFNRLKAKYQHFYQGIRQLFSRGDHTQTLKQLTNAADNLPRIAGYRAGQGIRVRTTPADRTALTFVMQALKMSGEGLSAESAARLGELEFAGDPGGYLQTKATDMETLAQQFINEGKNLNAEAAIAAAKAMRYASRNFARLRPLANTVRAQFDKQFQREGNAGIDSAYEDWHVPQRHDLDLIASSDRPIVLGHSRGAGTATGFKKAKVYEDYATAIENEFVPRSLDIADLLEHRVNQGERLIQRKALFDRMRGMSDPVDGKSLAQPIPRRAVPRPDGTTDYQEAVPRGYQPFEVIPGYRLAVHEGYSSLMRALTGTSQISESAIVGTLQDIAGLEKHLALALDTFHASRTMQAELALTGKLSVGARQRLGRALVEYNLGDLQAAVAKGEITQEMADYIKTPMPIEVGGRTIRITPHALVQLGARNGLNLARFNDALYKDWIREIPITGAVNKWVFDKLTRSAITHGFLAEFQRVAKQNPTWDATKVARQVASDVNVLFGNLQKESIFRNPSVKAINQILFLAPNWVEALARREVRAAKQLGRTAIDVVKGRPSGPARTIQTETGETTVQPMTHVPHFGTASKGIGTGLAAYFAAAQVLNLITRGHLTFSNEEKGHKLDAWIPDATGKTKGFFISPLSVFGEITHDIIRYAHSDPDIWSAVNRIGSNKMGNLGRFLEVVISGRDPANNEKLIGSGRRAMMAGAQVIPFPISLSQAGRAVGSRIAPGIVPAPAPGSVQRQLAASAGFKTEPAGTAQRQIYAKADEWKSKSPSAKLRADVERRLKEDFGPSDYANLRGALLRNDLQAARRAFDELRKTKEPQVINRALRHPHPFTGSAANERSFIRSLSDSDKRLYKEALEERKQLYTRYRQMLNQPE
jgi:hypothetical protein